MQINLFNARKPNGKRVPVTVDLVQVADPNKGDGEVFYILTLTTQNLDKNKQAIAPIILNLTSTEDLSGEIEKGLGLLAEKIDWGILESDNHKPIITKVYPTNGQKNVSYSSNVSITVKDPFPMSGLDVSSIKLTANGIDITNELQFTGNINEAKIIWAPKRV